jgi:hypothetical protein
MNVISVNFGPNFSYNYTSDHCKWGIAVKYGNAFLLAASFAFC